jgi:hypothetical protein
MDGAARSRRKEAGKDSEARSMTEKLKFSKNAMYHSGTVSSMYGGIADWTSCGLQVPGDVVQ